MNIQKQNAFTLVELIVVITILAILGTIAFISLQGYSSQSRDSVRISDLSTLKTGLELFYIDSGKFPLPDNITGTGEVNGDILTYVGNIGDNISRIAKISKVPVDPLSNHEYVYGVDVNRGNFQIAMTLENLQSYNPILSTSYASDGYFAKVEGNYNGLLVKGDKIYNLPSLIFNGTGNLLSTGSYFVVDKQPNLPYGIKSNLVLNNKTTVDLISEITGNKTNTLTGVTRPNTMDDFTNLTRVMLGLGYDLNTVGKAVLGNKYIVSPSLGDCILGNGIDSGSTEGTCSL